MKTSPFRLKTEEELERLRNLDLPRKVFMRRFRIGNALYDELIRKPEGKLKKMRDTARKFEEYYNKNKREVDLQFISMNISAFKSLHELSERTVKKIMGKKRDILIRYAREASIPPEIKEYRRQTEDMKRAEAEMRKNEYYWR